MRKVLLEQSDDDPLILVKFIHRAIKAIIELRSDTAANGHLTPKAKSQKEGQDSKLEGLLQKAENDIRQRIRVRLLLYMAKLNDIYINKIEQQMRLLIENLQSQNSEWEKERASLKAHFKGQIRVLNSYFVKTEDFS